MSRITETRERTGTYEVTVAVVCDICGERRDKVFAGSGKSEWSASSFEVLETAVCLKEGKASPDGGHHEETEFDICPDCFRNKLMVWLRVQGAEPSVRNVDY